MVKITQEIASPFHTKLCFVDRLIEQCSMGSIKYADVDKARQSSSFQKMTRSPYRVKRRAQGA